MAFKYKVTKDGLWLLRYSDNAKLAIPSPIRLRNYAGERTQLDIGQEGNIKAITRRAIDESDFSLGDPARYNDGKNGQKATKVKKGNGGAQVSKPTSTGGVQDIAPALRERAAQMRKHAEALEMIATDIDKLNGMA